MSVSRSTRCLLRQSRQWSSLPVPASRRCIHQTSKQQRSDNKPAGSNKSKASVPAPRKTQNVGTPSSSDSNVPLTREAASKYFPPYTAEEMEFLRRKYTPEQIEAIEAGESAIDPLDLLQQGAVRTDSMSVKYLDDFRNIHPVLDKKRTAPDSEYDTKMRFKTDDEMDQDLADFWEKQAQKGVENEEFEMDFEKFMDDYSFMVGKNGEPQRDLPDFIAPQINKLTDPNAKRAIIPEEERGKSTNNKDFWDRLSAQTGLSVKYMRLLRSKNLLTKFVSNQTRMGKIRSAFAVTVCGNEAGLLGIGIGKSTDMSSAQLQALGNAIRGMVPIPRYEGRTIYGDSTGKVGAAVVNLYNRPPGFGIRCQEKIYYMCRCAGITDLSARMPRSTNPMNTIKATFEALVNQRVPEEVARGRGKKMIDVRKVYFAGMN